MFFLWYKEKAPTANEKKHNLYCVEKALNVNSLSVTFSLGFKNLVNVSFNRQVVFCYIGLAKTINLIYLYTTLTSLVLL